MVRTARFSEIDFIDATMALVAEGGPAAATMQAIARRVGAPTGSIYHRFESRTALLAMAWNRAYGSFISRLSPLLRAGRPQDAARAILPWSQENELRARFLLLNDPTTLFEDNPPPAPLRDQLEEMERAFDEAFQACVAACGDGSVSDEQLARAKFLIFDAPIAILRPYLGRGAEIPAFASQMIADLHSGMAFGTGLPSNSPLTQDL